MSLATELRQALEALGGFAKRDLDRILGRLGDEILAAQGGDDRAKARVAEALHALLPGLADRYQLAAAALAADLYDEDRERQEVAGSFRADPVDVPDGGNALAGWSTHVARTVDGLASFLNGGMTKRIMQAGNQTIMEAAIADPQSGGWQRQARGSGCYFCRMLAGRGAVYTEATADFSAHDHCHCVAVSAWRDRARPVKPFTPSARNISAAEKKRVAKWIDEHPDDLEGVPEVGKVERNGQKAHRHEIDTAERLASLGNDVTFRRRSHTQTSPDFDMGGHIWEAKSPTGNSNDTIPRQFKDASRQSDRLILDLSRSPRPLEVATREARDAFQRYDRLVEAMVIREIDGRVEVIAHWRR
ncbi:hypothetical protein [Pimelobacter simplex]|uniref:VG15 protein n=1 Tax=Nocardioides simplex TaxID=2045 RepID=UPI003AB04B70